MESTWLVETVPGRIVALSTAEYCDWLSEQDAKNGLRTAGSKGELRTGIHQEDTMTENYTPIDPYAADLAKLVAAEATPASRFEEQHKADRLREFADEWAEMNAHIAATPQPRLTTAELAEYAAPDPYAAGIKALQARDARARDAKEKKKAQR